MRTLLCGFLVLAVAITLAVWPRHTQAACANDRGGTPCGAVACHATDPASVGPAGCLVAPQMSFGYECKTIHTWEGVDPGTGFETAPTRVICVINGTNVTTLYCGNLQIRQVAGGPCDKIWQACGGPMVNPC